MCLHLIYSTMWFCIQNGIYLLCLCVGACVCLCVLYSGGWVTLCLTHDALVGDCILVNTHRLSIHLLMHRASVCVLMCVMCVCVDYVKLNSHSSFHPTCTWHMVVTTGDVEGGGVGNDRRKSDGGWGETVLERRFHDKNKEEIWRQVEGWRHWWTTNGAT